MAAELKTRPTRASVAAFLKKAATGDRLADAQWIVKAMQKATGAKPVMWGPSIVGFGTYAVRYADGHATDWLLTGFSPRKTALVLYGLRGPIKRDPALAKRLGKVKLGGGCLYIKRLADVDTGELAKLIARAVKDTRAKSRG